MQGFGILSALGGRVAVAADSGGASASVGVNVAGTFVGTYVFEATLDGRSWFAVAAFPLLASGLYGAPVLSGTAPGQYVVPTFGWQQVGLRFSAFTSGAADVQLGTGGAPLRGPDLPLSPPATLVAIAGTATITGPDTATPPGARGVLVVVDVTTLAGTVPTITPSVQAKDGVANKYVALLTAATAIGAAGTFSYLVYPGAGAAGAGIAQVAGFPLPATWRLVLTYGGTVTASAGTVGAHYLP